MDETWKAPKKLRTTETVASLRGENNELTKNVAKLEKAIAKLQEQAQALVQKKRKLNIERWWASRRQPLLEASRAVESAVVRH